MQPTFAKIDYIARFIDNGVYIGLGVAILILAPHQIRRKLECGKLTVAKAKSMSKVVRPLGFVIIGYGIFRIFS
jgi:hypothetical protein